MLSSRMVSAPRRERLVDLLERARTRPRPSRRAARRRAPRATAGVDAAGRGDVVVLDQDAVVEAER